MTVKSVKMNSAVVHREKAILNYSCSGTISKFEFSSQRNSYSMYDSGTLSIGFSAVKETSTQQIFTDKDSLCDLAQGK